MFDSHTEGQLPNWGILPYIDLGFIRINSYSLFLFLGLIVGVIVFYHYVKTLKKDNDSSFSVLMSGLIGGIIGAKIPIWIAYWDNIKTGGVEALLSGRTVVGGLIGGALSVFVVKRILKIKTRIGNAIAPGAAIGIAIGRIGCFLQGCCYGQATNLPWGVDFGDGIRRHPTQLYESFFLLILFGIIISKRKVDLEEGLLFDIFLLVYFGFRFLIEFIRVEPKVFYGFSLYQVASLVVIIYVLVKMIVLRKKL